MMQAFSLHPDMLAIKTYASWLVHLSPAWSELLAQYRTAWHFLVMLPVREAKMSKYRKKRIPVDSPKL